MAKYKSEITGEVYEGEIVQEQSVLSPCVKTENILIYTIQQYDTHFNNMCAEFGHFTDRDKAIKAMMNGFEELYPGFKDDVYANGDNQWITDEFDFGVVIVEIDVNNTFCEQ